MAQIDYVSERRKLIAELAHHHFRPTYVGLDRPGSDNPRWRVGGDATEGCPEQWAGLPIVYVDSPDLPRGATRDWLRRDNPLGQTGTRPTGDGKAKR